jgi:hypothetical protein
MIDFEQDHYREHRRDRVLEASVSMAGNVPWPSNRTKPGLIARMATPDRPRSGLIVSTRREPC